jgi:hypothetical protein
MVANVANAMAPGVLQKHIFLRFNKRQQRKKHGDTNACHSHAFHSVEHWAKNTQL